MMDVFSKTPGEYKPSEIFDMVKKKGVSADSVRTNINKLYKEGMIGRRNTSGRGFSYSTPEWFNKNRFKFEANKK